MVFRPWQIVITLLFLISCNTTKNSKLEVEKRNIPVELHNGDIAFRRGIGAASRIVLAADSRGSYSHVGVVVCIDSVWRVVHAVPYEGKSVEDDHVYCDEISEFFTPYKAVAGAIYRHNSLDSAGIAAISNYAIEHYKKETPFDHDYDLSDDTLLYCSELVWRCYLKAGIDISKGERTDIIAPCLSGRYILPCDIEINDNLHSIYSF